VTVLVEDRNGIIYVVVSDDGRGFSEDQSAAALRQGHLGLATLTERVAIAGGRFTVGPRDGGGTELAVELPRPSDGKRSDPEPGWLPLVSLGDRYVAVGSNSESETASATRRRPKPVSEAQAAASSPTPAAATNNVSDPSERASTPPTT
jgi:hypothetical protein